MNYFIAPGLITTHPKQALMDRLTKHVSYIHATTPDQVKSKTRIKNVKDARFECMYLLKKTTNMTLAYIGDYYNRDHASVLHAVQTIDNEQEYDRDLKGRIRELKKHFGIQEIIKNN